MIVHTRAVKRVIDHIGLLSFALLESFVRNLRLAFQEPLKVKKQS